MNEEKFAKDCAEAQTLDGLSFAAKSLLLLDRIATALENQVKLSKDAIEKAELFRLENKKIVKELKEIK